MGNVVAGSEVVALGIEIEKNGRDFYNALVTKSKHQKAKELFQYLAGEEERHITAFQNVLDSLKKFEPAESYPGEYFAYMNALAGDYIFTRKNKGQELAKRIKSEKEAVDLGIGFEKDSVIFYEGMVQVVPKDEHDIIDNLIRQELGHLQRLYELKKQL
jgi:rubrerythrin